MTREEAIEILKQFKKCLSDVVFDEKGSEAWQMAIEALEQLPSVTQKSAKDYLDMADRKAKKIKDALTDNPQKSGVWVEIDDEPHEVWECNHCGFVIDGSGCIEPYEYRDIYKYCPNCGAKMESEDKTK